MGNRSPGMRILAVGQLEAVVLGPEWHHLAERLDRQHPYWKAIERSRGFDHPVGRFQGSRVLVPKRCKSRRKGTGKHTF